MIHRIENRAGASHRLASEIDGLQRFNGADPVMIHNLEDLRFIEVVHSLRSFRMIDKNQSLFLHIDEAPPGDHAHIPSIVIRDGKIAVSVFSHYLTDIIDEIILLESDDILLLHQIAGRYALIDQARNRIGVEGGADHDAGVLLRQLPDLRRYLLHQRDDEAACPQLDGLPLRVLTVAGDDKIVLLNIMPQMLRTGRADHDLSLAENAVLISDYHVSVDRLGNIVVFRLRFGHNRLRVGIDIVLGDVIHGKNAFEFSVLRHDRKRDRFALLHVFPCNPDGNIVRRAFGIIDVHIVHLSSDIRQIAGRITFPVFQHKLCLFIDLSGSACLVTVRTRRRVLQIGERDR